MAAADSVERNLTTRNHLTTEHPQMSLPHSSSSSTDAAAEQLPSHQGAHTSSTASFSPHSRTSANSAYAQASPQRCISVGGGSRNGATAVDSAQLVGREDTSRASAAATSSHTDSPSRCDEQVSSRAGASRSFLAGPVIPIDPRSRHTDRASTAVDGPGADASSSTTGGPQWISRSVNAAGHTPSASLRARVDSSCTNSVMHATQVTVPQYSSNNPTGGSASPGSRSERNFTAAGSRFSADCPVGCPTFYTAAASVPKDPIDISGKSRATTSLFGRHDASLIETSYCKTRTSRRSPVEAPRRRTVDTPPTLPRPHRGETVVHFNARAGSHPACSAARVEHRETESPAGARMHFSSQELGVVGAATQHRESSSAARGQVANRGCAVAASGAAPASTPCAGAPCTAPAVASEGNVAAIAAGAITPAAASAFLSIVEENGSAGANLQADSAVFRDAVATCAAADSISEDRLLQQHQSGNNVAPVSKDQLLFEELPLSGTLTPLEAPEGGDSRAEKVLLGQPGAVQHAVTAAHNILQQLSINVIEATAGTSNDSVMGEEDTTSKAMCKSESSRVHQTRDQHMTPSPSWSSAAHLAKEKTPQPMDRNVLGRQLTAGFENGAAAGVPRGSEVAAEARPSSAVAGAVPHREYRSDSLAGARAQIAPPVQALAAATATASRHLPPAPPPATVPPTAADKGVSVAGRAALAAAAALPAAYVSPAESHAGPDVSATKRTASPQGDAAGYRQTHVSPPLVPENQEEQICRSRACSRSAPAQQQTPNRRTSHTVLESRRAAAGATVSAVGGPSAAGDTPSVELSVGLPCRAAAAAACAEVHAAAARPVTTGGSSRSCSVKNSSSPAIRSSDCTAESGTRCVNTTVGRPIHRGSSSAAEKPTPSSLLRSSHRSSSGTSSTPDLVNCKPTNVSRYGVRHTKKSSIRASSSGDGSKSPQMNDGRGGGQVAASPEERLSKGKRHTLVVSIETNEPRILMSEQRQERPVFHGAGLSARRREQIALREQADGQDIRADEEAAAVQQPQPADKHVSLTLGKEIRITVGQQGHPPAAWLQELSTAAAVGGVADLRQQNEQMFSTSLRERQRQKEAASGGREQRGGDQGAPGLEHLQEQRAVLSQQQWQQPTLPLQQQQRQKGALLQQTGMPQQQSQLVEEGLQLWQHVLQQHVDQPPQVRVVAVPPCIASQRQQSQTLAEKEQEEAPKQLTQQQFKDRGFLQQASETVFLRRHVTLGGAGGEEDKPGITAKAVTCAGPKSPTSSSSALVTSSCWPSSYVSSAQQVFVSYSLPSSGSATSSSPAASLKSSLCGSSVDSTFSERKSFASTGHYSCRSSQGSSAFSSPGSGTPASPSFRHGAPSEANNPSNVCLEASSSCRPSIDISRWRAPHRCPQPRPSQCSAACEKAEATAGRETARERIRPAAAAPDAIDVIPPAAPRASAGGAVASVDRGRHGKSSLATAAARSGLRLLEELTELPGPEGQHARTLACFLRRHTGTEVVSSGPSETATAGAAQSSIPTTFSSCSKLPLFYPATNSLPKPAPHNTRLNIDSSRGSSCACLSCGTMAAGCTHAQAAGDSSTSYGRRDPAACSCEERTLPLSTSRGGYRVGRETGESSNSAICGAASSAPSSSVDGDSRSRSAAARLGEEASRPAAAAGLSSLGLNLCSVDETARRSSAATATTVASGSETLKDTQKQLVELEDQLVPKSGQRTFTLLPQATKDQRRFGQEQQSRPKPRRDLVGQQERHAAAAHASPVNAELSGARAAAAADEAFSKQADEGQSSLAAAAASRAWSRRPAESLSLGSMTSVLGGGSHASGSLSDGAFYNSKRHADPGDGEQSDMSGEGSFETVLSSKGLHLAERNSQCSSEDRREQKSSGALQLSGSRAETFVEPPRVGSSSARVSGSSSVSAHRIEGRAIQLVGSCEELLLPLERMEQSRHAEQQPQRAPESQAAPATETSWESEGSRRPWKMSLDVPRLLVAAAAAVGRNYWSYFGRTNTTPASSDGRVVDAAASAAVGGRTQQWPAGDDNTSLTPAMRSSPRRGAQQDGFCEAGAAARRLKSMPAELRKHSSQWEDGSAAAAAQAETRRRNDMETPAVGQETERRQLSAADAAASHEKSDFVAGAATAAAAQSNVAAAARCCDLVALQKQHAGGTTTTIICGAEEKVLREKGESWEQQEGEKNLQLCRASPSQHEEGLQQRLATGAAPRPRRSTCRFCRARAATNYQLHQQSAVERGGALVAGPSQLPSRSLQLVRRRSKRRSSSRSRSSSGAGVVRSRSRWSRRSRSGSGSRSSSKSSAWRSASSGRGRRGSSRGSNDSTAGAIREERAAESQRESNASSFRTVVAAGEMWGESRWRRELSVDRRVSSEGDTGFTFPSLTLRKKLWTTATTPAAICSCSGSSVRSDSTQQEGGHTGGQQAVSSGVGLPAESNSFCYSVSSRRFAEIDAHARNAAAAAGAGPLEAPAGYPVDLTESSLQSTAPLASRQPYRRRRHGRRLHGARRRPEEGGELDGADSKTVAGAAGEKKRPAAAADGGVQTYTTRAAQLGLLYSGRSGDDDEGRGTAEESLRDSSLLISHEASAAASHINVSRHKWEVTGIGTVDGRRRTTQAHFFSRGGAYDLSTLWPSHQQEELRRGVLWWFRRDVKSSYLSFSSWFGVRSERSADTNSDRSEDPSPQQQQKQQVEDEEAPPHTASPRGHHAEAAAHRGPTDRKTSPARDAVAAGGTTICAETGGASAADPTGAAGAAVAARPQHTRTSKRAIKTSKTESAAIGPLTRTTVRSTFAADHAEEASCSVAEQWHVDFRKPSAGPNGRFVTADLSQQPVVFSEGRMDSLQDEQGSEPVEVKVDASEGRGRGETAAAGERSPRSAGASTGQRQRLTSLWPRIAAELRALEGRASEEARAAAEESVWRSVGEAHIAGALSRISVALRKEEDRWPSWSSQVAALSHSPRLSFWGTSRRGSRETLSPQQEDETSSRVSERDTAAAAGDAGKKDGSATKRLVSHHLAGGQQEQIAAPASPQDSSSEATRSAVAADSAVAGDAGAAAAEAGVQPAAQTSWPASAPATTVSVPVAATTAAGEARAAAAAAAKERGVGLAAATEGRGDVAAAVQRGGDSSRQTTLSVGAAENVGGLLCRVSSCSWVNPPARRPCRMQRILAKAQKRDLELFLRRRLRALSNSTAGAAELRDQSTSSSSSGGDSSDDEERGRNSWSRDVAAVACAPPTSPALVRSPKGKAVSSACSSKKRASTSETVTDSYAGGCASAAARASSHGEPGSTATAGWSTSDRDGSVSTRSSSVRVVREQEKHRDVNQCDSWREPRAAYSSETSSSVEQLSHQAMTLSREPCSGRDGREAAPPRGAPRETAAGSAPRLRTALQRSNTIPFAPEEAYRSSGVVAGARGGRLAPGTAELSECLRAFPQCILEALIRDTRSSSWQEQQRQLLRCRRHLQKHRRRLQAREPSMKVVHSSRGSLGDWQLIPTRSKSDSPAVLPKTIVSGERGGKDLAKPGGGRREQQRQEAAVGDEDGDGRQMQGGGAVKGILLATAAAEGPAAAAAVIPRGRFVLKSVKRNVHDSAGGLEEGLRPDEKQVGPLDERGGSAVAAARSSVAEGGRGAAATAGSAPAAGGNAAAGASGNRQSQGPIRATPSSSHRPVFLSDQWRVRDTVRGRTASGPPEAFRDSRKGAGDGGQGSTSASPALPRSNARPAVGRQAAGDGTEKTASRERLSLWLGAHSIPRDDKRYRGGEDAWFLSSTCNAMGVADGVSEWEDLAGINPQKFAQDLMRGTFKHLRRLKKLKALGLIQGIRAAAAQRNSEKKAAAATKRTAEGSAGTGQPPRPAGGVEARGREAGAGNALPKGATAAAGEGVGRAQDDEKNDGEVKENDEEKKGGESPDAAAAGDSCASLDAAEMARVALTWSYHEAKHYGSSTALVGVLDERTGVIGFANLGDSSGMVLRRLRRGGSDASAGQPTLGVVRRVKEMQHSFNVPYQFGHVPAPEDWSRLRSTGLERLVSIAEKDFRQRCNQAAVADGSGRECAESAIGDLPTAIEKLTVRVQEGDLILIGTDGLFDNVFDYEITALSGLAVSPAEAKKLFLSTSHATPPSEVARALALAAYWRSLDPTAQTPFSKETKKQLNLHGGAGEQDGWRSYLGRFAVGGKEDDITVVAAWVVTEADATPGLIGTGVVPGESLSQEEEEMLLVDEDD